MCLIFFQYISLNRTSNNFEGFGFDQVCSLNGASNKSISQTFETVTGFSLTPVLGLVRGPVDLIPEAGEVDEVFEVPLSHVLDPANYRVEGRRWRGQRRQYYAVPWGPYYIWGATARMLRGLADRMADADRRALAG